MKRHIKATLEILSGKAAKIYASYVQGAGEITIIFSHSSVTMGSDLQEITWQNVESLIPGISELSFNNEKDILVYDDSQKRWQPIRSDAHVSEGEA